MMNDGRDSIHFHHFFDGLFWVWNSALFWFREDPMQCCKFQGGSGLVSGFRKFQYGRVGSSNVGSGTGRQSPGPLLARFPITFAVGDTTWAYYYYCYCYIISIVIFIVIFISMIIVILELFIIVIILLLFC